MAATDDRPSMPPMKDLLRHARRALRQAAYALAFPFYSLLSPKLGFAVFFPGPKGWRVWTRGRVIPVREPQLWALEYFRHNVPRRGATVFDVGGELGLETEQFAGLVGEQGRVFVFECLPDHLKHLRELARRYPQVEVVDRACWNAPCRLEFFVGHTAGSGTAVVDARGQHGQALADVSTGSLLVTAEPLDELWRRLVDGRPVDFLKMDIEGSEYEALDGASELLRHTRHAVIAAYHLRDGVATAPKVDERLRAAGFRTRIDENNHVYAWR